MTTYKVFYTESGAPKTLLTPSIITYKKVSNGDDVTPIPDVDEIGGGGYKFTAAPAEELLAVVDGGSGALDQRYLPLVVGPHDGNIANLDAAVSAVPDTVWDEVITTHLTDNTAGQVLNELKYANILEIAQIQGATASTVTLAATANANDKFYNRTQCLIATGPAAGQVRLVNTYNGTSKVAEMNRDWVVSPGAGAYYVILPQASVRSASDVEIDTAAGGGVATITLGPSAVALDDWYNRTLILLEAGVGEGQSRLITAYNGASKVATVARAWEVQPDNTSRYTILPFGSVGVAEIDAGLVPTIEDMLRLLGLSHENAYIDQVTYNANGRRTGARLRSYSVAGSVGTDNDVLATYAINVTWDTNGRLETYKVIKQ